ncbi:peptidase M14 [Rasiella rasia]|uniref:Peptidase M14 n=1 Tax=Rasiella rasia TaxID=2744027 RepID=A0A6G6GIY6_9FLAO|nr:M14 family zinc carboxypeptidase [Rasiella rasia]QIE58556.1 peptidase M14 [Rasiella rasia]
MKIIEAYPSFFESRLGGRYITQEIISPLLSEYKNDYKISVIGSSEMGRNIEMIVVGNGPKKILAWSQMHGNESTTTKAIFDVLKFLRQKNVFQEAISTFLNEHSLYIIPILNPDGAVLYTRENANEIDLNRDAQQQSQAESRVLAKVFKDISPHLCLNLHDQRTIYGFETGKVATVSFLAPAANEERSITPARQAAMNCIENMARALSCVIPGQIGRYDDSFNANCVGDSFQMANVPTILFEAGHYPNDYQREETRKYIGLAMLTLFGFVTISEEKTTTYQALPENKKNYYDVLIKNVKSNRGEKKVSIALQYREVLQENSILFVPYIESIGDLDAFYGHKEIDANGMQVLINSQKKYEVGNKVSTIISKKENLVLFLNEN